MGLTIHWDLRAPADSMAGDVRKIVESLRQRALDLPFGEVSDIIERTGDIADANKANEDDPLSWFLIQATENIIRKVPGGRKYISVIPQHIIGVSLWPGKGCEEMNLFLCKYPRRKYWQGNSFCKTQYASNPECGGVPNFLRCHMSAIAVLDEAKRLGVLKRMNDESDFWKKRDVKALIEEIGDWNQFIASFGQALQNGVPDATVDAQIFEYPDFEELAGKRSMCINDLIKRIETFIKGQKRGKAND